MFFLFFNFIRFRHENHFPIVFMPDVFGCFYKGGRVARGENEVK